MTSVEIAPARRTSAAEAAPAARGLVAKLTLHVDFASAAADWAEAEAACDGSPYQSRRFCEGWLGTAGEGLSPLIAVARDEYGALTALLPLARRRLGPLHAATLIGDRAANYQMGLFRDGAAWSKADVQRLLSAVAKAASPRVDVFTFIHQPREWRGAPCPLAQLSPQPAPSQAYASALPPLFADWLDAHFSKATQKKLRKKAKKLEALGPVTCRRAEGAEEIARALDAFLEQKNARMRAKKLGGEFEQASTVAMLRALSAPGGAYPALEWHVLQAGERIAAVWAGFAYRDRLSGLVLSFDADPAVAAASPGEQLVIEVVRGAILRGFSSFDLGVGEARYKDECCEIAEPLVDSAYAASPLGALAAVGFLMKRRATAAVKRSPRLLALARKLRGA